MMRLLRWLKRGVLGALVLAVVGIVIGLIVLHTDWGREQVRQQLEAALQDRFPGSKVRAVTGSILGELKIHDLELRGAAGTTLAKISEVRVEIALTPLIASIAHVDRLVADGVQIYVGRDMPRPATDQEPSSWAIELPDIEIRRASVAITAGDEVIELDEVMIAARVAVPIHAPLTGRMFVAGRWPARGVPLSAALTVRVDDTIIVPHLVVSVGDALVTATDVHVAPLAGRVMIAAPARTIAALAPGVQVPGDVLMTIVATPIQASTRVVLDGAIGATRIHGSLLAEIWALSGRGVIAATGLDLGPLTEDQVRGDATAVVAFTVDPSRARATVISRAAIAGTPPVHAIVAVDADVVDERGTVLAIASGGGGLRVGAVGGFRRVADQIHLETTHAGLGVRDPRLASGGRAPVTGSVDAEAVLAGPLATLGATGTFRGTRLGYDDLSVGRASGRFSARLGPIGGSAHVELERVARAGELLGAVSLDATMRPDQRIAVSARVRPAAAAVVLDATAVVTLGPVIDVALGSHRAQTGAGVWSGTGGRVRIDDRRITVSGLRSASGAARVTADATIARPSGAITADIAIENVPAAILDPAYQGTIAGSVSLERVGTQWSGSGLVTGTQIAIAADAPAVDGELRLAVEGRRVTVTATASNAEIGRGRLVVEVEGPRDLTDLAAWLRVPRADLQTVIIGIDRLDLAAASGGRTTGEVAGTLEIRGGVPSGAIKISGVATPLGQASADMTLALTEVGFVDVSTLAIIDTVGQLDADLRLRIPDRPFDPAAWQRLGPKVLDRVNLAVRDIAIDSRMLALAGLSSALRGRVSAQVEVGAGGSSAALTLEVHDVRGGQLVRPVDVKITGMIDAAGTAGTVRVSTGPTTLAEITDARSPATIAQWVADPRGTLGAAVAGTLAIPRAEVRDVLALLGRTDVLRGTLEGAVVLGGTLRSPHVAATFDLRDVAVRPRLARTTPPILTALHVEAGWDGARARLAVTGEESNRGTLAIELGVRPDRLASLAGTVKIKSFDVAPVVAFLPGPLMAASGKVDADLTIAGIDVFAGSITGKLKLLDGRLPLVPIIGTLRRANAEVTIDRRGISATLDGRIGAGTVKLAAVTGLDGAETKVTGTISKISPVTASQPVLGGELRGTLRRDGRVIRGTLTISGASVQVPERTGNELLDAAVPDDVIFVDQAITVPRLIAWSSAPARPWLVVDVKLLPARILVPEFAIVASAVGDVTVSVGDVIGLDGEISVERGNADVLGHRYRVELGRVTFDGTIDPRFDIQLAHDFPDVTTFVRFSGRLSALDKVQRELTSDPAIYSENQLLGFLLGGEPGGDPTTQTTDAAAGFGAAIASSSIGRRLKKLLPITLDVARCGPGSGTDSGSCTLGSWVTRKAFVSYKRRIGATGTESANVGMLEYYWRPNLTLELGGSLTEYGADVLWRFKL